MLSIQRNTLLSSSVNLQTDALSFLCVCLQTLGQITFAHNFLLHTDFPTAASLCTVVRCFVNLDQSDDLTQNDSIKRLALPNVVCSDARLFCKNKQVNLKNKPKIGN